MLSFHSQVSSNWRVVGAEPELWSITSEITITVTHLDSLKEREREGMDKRSKGFISELFSNHQTIQYGSHGEICYISACTSRAKCTEFSI